MESQSEQTIWGFNRQVVSACLLTGGVSLFTISFLYVNEHKFHPATTGLIRGIAVTFLSFLVARYRGIDVTYPSGHNFKWQIIRNSIMVIQGLCYAWVQFYLPLPIVLTLMASSPIFTAIFDKLLNDIDLNKTQVIWFLIAFIGVILTANGSYLQYLITGDSYVGTTQFKNYFTKDPVVMAGSAIFFTFIMCLHGYAIVTTKKLINTNTIQINFILGTLILLSSAIILPSALSDPDYHCPSIAEMATALFLTGLPMALGQFLGVSAFILTRKLGMITPFQFTSIILGYLVSIFRYDQSVNIICLIGGLSIILGVIFIIKSKESPKNH